MLFRSFDIVVILCSQIRYQREIAAPLAKKKNTPGSDTGFWTVLEEKLDIDYKTNGNERTTGQAWLK